VSQYQFGVDPIPAHFVRRDKTQAGLSNGLIMIQSDLKGGSMHAFKAAFGYGRWIAVPHPTQQDIDAREPKIEANLTMASEDTEAKMQILNSISEKSLKRLIIIRGKCDYSLLPI